MGTLEQRYRAEEDPEDIESAAFPESFALEEGGRRRAYAAAERRWVKAIQGAIFEESRQAQKREPKFRGESPMQYGHGSSLL